MDILDLYFFKKKIKWEEGHNPVRNGQNRRSGCGYM